MTEKYERAFGAVTLYETSEGKFSLLMSTFAHSEAVFLERAAEGWLGGGYDWGSIARVLIAEQAPELEGRLGLDPEGSMFCAYGTDREALEALGALIQSVVDDHDLLRDALSRAELD